MPEPLPQCPADLERELEPRDLLAEIRTYVLGEGQDPRAPAPEFDNSSDDKYQAAEEWLSAKAARLGEDFAASGRQLDELGADLFSGEGMRYRRSFGGGLAKGTRDLRAGWDGLIDIPDQSSDSNHDFSVIGGFIEEVATTDPRLARELLDDCAKHPKLRQDLVGLHPPDDFTEADLDRCMALLDSDDTNPWMYEPILCRDKYAHLPPERLIELAERLLARPNGDDVLLQALSMKLDGKDPAQDTLGLEFRRLGLQAAARSLLVNHNDREGMRADNMGKVIGAALSFDGNEAEKSQWIDAIFSIVDKRRGCIYSFGQAIEITAKLMLEAFLDRVFQGKEEQQDSRAFFLRDDTMQERPLYKVAVSDLIGWCRKQKKAAVWGVVASGIDIWEKRGDNSEGITIKASAIEFLEAAPKPKKVLDAYATRITSFLSLGGRHADTMQLKADAIERLTRHDRNDIAKAACSALERLTEAIEFERMLEEQRDKRREQRFE